MPDLKSEVRHKIIKDNSIQKIYIHLREVYSSKVEIFI